ncbi:MAG: (Fe-S)-binding protein [Candidatus Aenigmatarchaeota archaeon]
MSALKQVSLCVRCGKCLISCPTYSVLPLETLSPRGRVGLLDAIAKQQMDYQYAIKSLASCLLCARCEKACELKIPVTKAIAEVRHKMSTSSIPDFTESAIRLAFGTPESQRRNLRLLTKLKGLLPAGYVGGLLYRLLRLDSRAAAIVQELKKTTLGQRICSKWWTG